MNEWVELGQNKDGTHNICCGVCGVGKFKSRGHARSYYTRHKFKYCPNCGAKMADRKTENSSEKPNNSTISKMEQVDEDINVRSKDEPQTDEEYINNLPWVEVGNGEQTDIEIARAIVHKAIDDTPIAEDAYPDLRQKMHDAVDEYEPQTDCAWK